MDAITQTLITLAEIPPANGTYPSTNDGRRMFELTVRIGTDGIAHRVQVTAPNTPKQEAELRWYFEDHIAAPYTDQIRAQTANDSVARYGETLFRQVFDEPREIAFEFRNLRGQLQQLRIEIEGSPAFHALHWEAMRPPGGEPLALHAQVVRRRRTRQENPAHFRLSSQLRVLLVTARADDPSEVAYRTISRPLLEALANSALPVKIDLLRPGRYSALENHLRDTSAEHGQGHYHLIHFDLHGGVSNPTTLKASPDVQSMTFDGPADADAQALQGYLFFEPEDGAPSEVHYRAVNAATLAKLLTNHGIPMVLLNACQSAMQQGEQETSLGAKLLDGGVQVVVAMSYSVLVQTAKSFVARFYQKLVQKISLADALRDARHQLHQNPTRLGAFGMPVQLQDWLLPVIYQNRDLTLSLRAPTPEETAARFSAKAAEFPAPNPEFGFFGRDLDVLAIERRLLQHNLLLVRGMGGAGKTTLLRHLGHWWQQTGWLDRSSGSGGLVFEFAYDQKSWTRQQILHALAQKLLPPDHFGLFLSMPEETQQAMIVERLRAERHLLLFDNLETITGSTLAVGSALSETEQNNLREFLSKLVGGHSFILLGSRSSEDWLKPGTFGPHVHNLRGLDPEAREEMARKILKQIGREALLKLEDAQPADTEHRAEFHALQKLIKLLAGYPLAMQVVLPALDEQGAAQVLQALTQGDLDLDRDDTDDKTQSMLRCIDYAHRQLDADAQQLLACLAPFTGVFNKNVQPNYLNQLKQQPALSHLPFERWDEVLSAAERWGLLIPDEHNPFLLQLQPTLPFFLRGLRDHADPTRTAIEAAFREHYRDYGSSLVQLQASKDPQKKQVSYFLTQAEFENLDRALHGALQAQESIFNLLFPIYQVLGQAQDHRRRMDLLEATVAAMRSYPEQQLAGDFVEEWIGTLDLRAQSWFWLKQYSQAQAAFQETLAAQEAWSASNRKSRNERSASIYHMLGVVTQQLRQWSQAREYLLRALEIYNESNNRYPQMATYHHLGWIAQEQREWLQAESHFNKALEISVEFNDRYGQAAPYHHLGWVAQEQQQWSRAEAHLLKSLEIYIEFNERYEQADCYHHLGITAQAQQQWSQAKANYLRALQIKIEFDDRHGQARIYHQLGRAEQEQREWLQASENYLKALAIYIEFDDRFEQAKVCHQLGMVALAQSQWATAQEYLLKALRIIVEFEDTHSGGIAVRTLAELWRETGDAALLTAVAEICGDSPDEVEALFKSLLEGEGDMAVES